jgi:hypothetical protein
MRIRSSQAFLALFIVLAFLPKLASAASIYVSPQSDSYSSGKTFSARVRVSSNQAVNAVSGTLNFPTDKLQVTSVSKVGSILTLWVQDPSYDNLSGRVSFEGVVPNPGYSGSDGLVVSITFKVVGAGTANVNFSDASVLANDGSGTNILTTITPASYSLGGVVPAPNDTTQPPPPSGTPRAPVVTSSTHPSSSHWYQAHDAKFSWTAESDVTATRLLLGKSANSVPTQEYSPAISSKEVDKIDDGIWYLHVQNKNAAGWGAVTHFMVKIDSSAPETFSMKEVERADGTDPRVRLSLNASDNFSGIKSYGIQIDKGEEESWNDDGTGIFESEPLPPGNHSIYARAYDEAGNFATASVNISIEPIEGPKINSYTDKVSGSSPLIVRGTALPGATVKVILGKSGGIFGSADAEPRTQNARVDDNGNFSIAVNTQGLVSGAYDLTAVTVDKRGAQSEPTIAKTVLINASWLRTIGSGILSFLAIAIPAVALIFLLLIVFLRGYNSVKMTNRKYKASLRNVEELVDKSFTLLKEDVEDSIRLLERTKTKRKLTAEEDAIIERFRENLREAEKVIHGEMRKIEREL